MPNVQCKIDGFLFSLCLEKRTAEVVGCYDWRLIVYKIPSTITYKNTDFIVIRIGNAAFKDCKFVGIKIPITIKSIGNYAFEHCYNLESVDIPNSVTEIGIGAFKECYSLKTIVLPKYLRSIERAMFGNCSSLESIKMPSSLMEIGNCAFRSCKSLKSFTIPSTVKNIGADAFRQCTSLTSIYIPSSVASLSGNVFGDCTNLKIIQVSKLNIYYKSPSDCNAIIETASNTLITGCKHTTIPDCVVQIGEAAFFGSKIQCITIPETVKIIREYAFTCCSELSEINIGNGVHRILGCAFSNCRSLQFISIGSGLTNIDIHAFAGCNSLKSIVINGNSPIYDSRDNCNAIIETATNTLVIGCKDTKIPNGVITIGEAAFYGCGRLKSICIPDSVESIKDEAFSNCYSLESVVIGSGLANTDGNVFRCCHSLSSIVIDNNNPIYDSRENCNGIIETATNTLVTGCKDTKIPQGVTNIGIRSFENCWFSNPIVLPSSVVCIEHHAFYNSTGIKIHYVGTTEQWDAIEKGKDWINIRSIKSIYCTDGEIE